MRAASSLSRLALVGSLGGVLAPACSLGQGTGSVAGTLDVPDCWTGCFDLHPDFFAAISTNSTALEIRIQNGIDYETFSDGLVIVVDDSALVRGDPLRGMSRAGLLGQPLTVALPIGVTAPGVPIKPVANPSVVHATLYLGRTCRTQNVALYAMTCALSNGIQALVCGDASTGTGALDASASAGDGGTPSNVASSTITFNSLFDGAVNESNAQKRLTDADFDFYLADPREVSAGGLGAPPPCRGHLQGRFHFYFQRGRPAQPFP